MRTAALFPLAATLVLVAATAHAQFGGRHERERWRERPPTHADSTRTLAGPWQMWTHLGIGWLGAPADVRARYDAGMDAGVSGDRRFADRVALRVRLDYHDLPSRHPTFVALYGYPYTTNIGHGWSGSALGGVAVRTRDHLWLEGGAGGGYFRSGLGSGPTYVDPATGQTRPLKGGSGWGGAWGVGARYEFQPWLRDRILAEIRFISMDRGGTALRLWAVRVGYRAF